MKLCNRCTQEKELSEYRRGRGTCKVCEREYNRAYFDQRRAERLAALTERDGPGCQECNVTDAIEIDHIIPLSKGGEDALSNMQLLCRSHNASKGDKLPFCPAPWTGGGKKALH